MLPVSISRPPTRQKYIACARTARGGRRSRRRRKSSIEGHSMMKISNIYERIVLLLCTLTILLLLFPGTRQAQADGGAPNLAYVAGGSHGISVIDIGQQKVTSTIGLDGDPH